MTPGIRRLLTASVFALLVAAPIAALTPQAQAPTWPAQPTRNHQEGDEVTILFRASNHVDGATSYGATNLPPGLSINTATGLVSGTLTSSTPGTLDGSAGTRQVTITATNAGGSTPYEFTWNVSRFRKGDVFAGIGGGRYQVFDENGNFKYMLTAETEAEWLASGAGWGVGTTTGCGYNWVTRKMYFTSFDVDNDPHVIEIDPVPATSGERFPRNRISTFRSSEDETGNAVTGASVDNAPESVVFDGQGNMYVGHAGGLYNENWDVVDIEGRVVATTEDGFFYYYLDAAGNFLTYTEIVDGAPVERRVLFTAGVSIEGYLERWNGMPYPGNLVALKQGGRDLQKFTRDADTGALTRTDIFATHKGWQGTDWIDLASDQATMFYTSEWGDIYRYNVGPNPEGAERQLAPYVSLPPAGNTSQVLYALRLLPPGDGDGGLLVATSIQILRIAKDGRIVMSYDANADSFFGLNISPDGKSLWSAATDTGKIYKWDIASGRPLLLGPQQTMGVSTDAIVTQTHEVSGVPTRYSLDGMCVMGEYTAAQEVCGNNIDDDGDGEIDEVCQPIEACTNSSPGDDDGDGLVDSNDPDCGAEDICTAGGYTDPEIAGYCARHNYEGDTVTLLPAPGPPAHQGLYETFQITGLPSLPPGIDFDENAVATGTPAYTTLQNTDTPHTRTYQITVAVERRQVSDDALISSYSHKFNWTIENKNRAPVATPHTLTTRPGTAVAVNVLTDGTADSDPDTEDTITVTSRTNPANGTVTGTGAALTYTPNPGFVGQDSFTYTITDNPVAPNPALSSTATVTIDVVNRAPVVAPDAVQTRPGLGVQIPVLANDSDPDGDTFTITSNTSPAHGAVTVAAGIFTYTSTVPYTGTDTFTYTVTDQYGAAATGTVTVTIVNQPPIAVDDATTMRPGQTFGFAVLANDTDPDNSPDVAPAGPDPMTIAAFTQPLHGTVTQSGSTLTYVHSMTPTVFVGVDTFTYTIADSFGGTATATVRVTIVNTPPVAVDDSATTRPGLGVQIPVLANDSDPDGDTFTITSNTNPAHGAVTVAGGIFAYTSSVPYTGTDTFTYTVTDQYGAAATGTVTVTIVNQPPIAVDDATTMRPGQTFGFAVLANDSDPDNSPDVAPAGPDPMTITAFTQPAHGTVTQSGSTLTYVQAMTPTVFLGVDTFTYTIADSFGGTATATVRVTIVNTPPVAVDDSATTRPGQAVSITVLGNDTDADSDTLTVTANTSPANGTVSRTGNVFTYTSNAGYAGADSFEYTISDGFGGTDTATVRITMVNTPPVAGDDSATTRPGQAVSITVLGNDTDADSDTLTVTANTSPANGTVSRTGNVFTYTPNAGYVGIDSFEYTIADGFGGTDTAVVTITSNNQPPVAVDDSASMIAGGSPITVAVRANDPADPDGDTVTITAFTQPANGSVVKNANDTFTFTPAPGFSGVTTFTYTVSDGFGGTSTATVTITVVNLPPIARDDSATTAGTSPVAIPVMLNDNDPDNHVIAVTGATTPANGSVVVNANGTITYTANTGFQGTDTFFYTIRDGFGGTSTATVTVTVGPPNRFDPCVCATAKASPGVIWPPNHKQTEVVNVTNLVDPDGGPLTIKILGIYQDEPTNYLGDGETTIDAGGVGTSTAWVRAERTGNPNVPGNGRVYEIVFEATAQDGSTCQGSIFTGVPHDQGQGNYIQDDGIRYDSTVAGGPIVRNALSIENNLSDADVTAREFTAKYVAEARIGGGTARELLLGPVSDLDADSDHFNWTSGEDVFFLLSREGSRVEFSLLTSTQTESVTGAIDCPNGECSDIFIRAQSGGTGRITLSQLTLNGRPVAGTLESAVGGNAASLHLSGLWLDEGMRLGGVAKIEWTDSRPADAAVNFRIQVGEACPTEGGSSGGGTGTPPLARTDSYATQEDVPLTVSAADGVLQNDLTFAGSLTAAIVDSTSNGTLSLNANGSFTYTPNPGFNGQDTFRYRVNDGSLYSAPALVTIEVVPVLDPPTAVDDSATTSERVPVTIAVLANDTDAGGGAVSLTSLTQPARGSAVISGSSIVYTPTAGFIGLDTFTYTVQGAEGTDAATVTVNVVNVNEAPSAVNDAYSTQEDTPLTISAAGVRGNDSDPDAGDTLSAVLVTGPGNGTLSLNANGSFTYTPGANFNGTDTFTYRVRDAGGLDSNVATVTITVTAVNDPPVAVNDSYVVSEDSALQISAPGVKQNDTDPDTAAENLTITLVTGVQRGTLTLTADGSFLYSPLPNVSGSDTFTYRISDGNGSATATATIAITEVNDGPSAADDAGTTQEDTAVTIAVLPNDSDPDGSSLTLQGVTQPANGTAAVTGNQVRYTPAPNFSGTDMFTYTISDGTLTASAKVVVTVTSVNDPPTAIGDSYSTPQNTPLNVQTPGVLGNDSDPDQQSLTAQLVSQAAHGTVTLQAQGAFSYNPEQNYTGTDTFTYKVTDGTGESQPVVVTITVTASNRPPVAANDTYSTARNTPLTTPAPGVLQNDSDPDTGDTLTVTLISGTAANAGTVTVNPNGSFTFTPAEDYTGQATFRYRAVDTQNAQSNEAIATITVSASNRPPVASDDTYTAEKNTPLTVAAPGVLGGDSDPDSGDTITASLVSGPPASAGTLALNANGGFTFTPANNYTGTTTFRYRARDNHDADSDEATVSIEVKDVQTSGQVCYDGGLLRPDFRAYVDWNVLESGDVRVRATVSRNYADNTYGVNKIGWGARRHEFDALYRSDFGRLAFYDANGAKRMDFRIDYLSPLAGTPSGYGSRGVAGGQQADGGMVTGSVSDIVSMATSIDLNMNAFGYVSASPNHPLKTYSPPTNASYAVNATYPLWIWDVWYEATVKGSAFGSAGFGYPRLAALHASPAKADITTWRLVNCQ